MVKNYNKPEYIEAKRNGLLNNKDKIISLIGDLLEKESFGVLATKGEEECYTSLISFANNENLTKIAFATPIDTRKFKMIEKNQNLSILIDNRADNKNNLNDIVAITSLGKGRILKEKEEIEKWSQILINKHKYLDDFINAKTSAIILVDISNYYYVTSFQEVVEWQPI